MGVAVACAWLGGEVCLINVACVVGRWVGGRDDCERVKGAAIIIGWAEKL